MWGHLLNALKNIFVTAVFALPLTLVFFLLYRLNADSDGVRGGWTMTVFLTGWLVMFGCIWAARILIRFIRQEIID